MPIVISEIEIAVEVIPQNNPQGNPSLPQNDMHAREAIIKECVEKVMEIINLKNER